MVSSFSVIFFRNLADCFAKSNSASSVLAFTPLFSFVESKFVSPKDCGQAFKRISDLLTALSFKSA